MSDQKWDIVIRADEKKHSPDWKGLKKSRDLIFLWVRRKADAFAPTLRLDFVQNSCPGSFSFSLGGNPLSNSSTSVSFT